MIDCKPSERLRTSLAEGRSLVFASRISPTNSRPSIEESSNWNPVKPLKKRLEEIFLIMLGLTALCPLHEDV